MPQKNSKKTLIIIIILVVLGLGAFFYFQYSPDSDANSTLESSSVEGSSDAQVSSARVLNLLNQINSLKIDTTLFTSAVYRSLVDYTVEVPEQGVGRPNPFAPTNGTNPTSAATTSSNTKKR